MSPSRARIAALGPEKQELLHLLLEEAGVGAAERAAAAEVTAPASFGQRQLFFVEQLAPGQPVYNLPLALDLEGPLSLSGLAATLSEIERRHEMLRTAFRDRAGELEQVVAPPRPLRVPVIDLSGLADGSEPREALRLASGEARRGFDLETGPLWRQAVIRLANGHHWILVTLHHIVADDWSAGVLVREIGTIYAAQEEGRSAPLPAPPRQYREFAAWQTAPAQRALFARQLEYWRAELSELPPPALLPTDRPRRALPRFAGRVQQFRATPELSARLGSFAQSRRLTLFMVSLAALQVLIGRWSRAADFAFGVPVANRRSKDWEGLIGCFANTIVLRARLGSELRFVDLLDRVRRLALDAYRHQDVPFELLVEALRPERGAGQAPLFELLFGVQNVPREGFALPGLRARPVPLHSGTAPFEMTFVLGEEDGRLIGAVEYATELFEPTTIERFGRQYLVVLEAALAAPERRIGELALLSANEREELWSQGSGAGLSAGGPQTLDALVAEAVARFPHAVAAASGPRQLTFLELDRRANRLAHRLRRLGIGADMLVGLLLPPSLELAVALLGTLKAGAAFLPLDPSWPPARLAAALGQALPPVLLTLESLLVKAPPAAGEVICLDAAWTGLDREPTSAPNAGGEPDLTAYAFFTSGSTGEPRGVLVPHRAAAAFAQAAAGTFGLVPADRVLQLASPSFDVLIEETFPAWASGAAVVFGSLDLRSDPAALDAVLLQQEITVVELPAPLWAEWVELRRRSSRRSGPLRLVLVGCEKPTAGQVARWQPLGLPLVHVFGLTETAVTNTFFRLPAGEALAEGASEAPIGRPLPGCEVHCLDELLEPVPVGFVGELFVGGNFLARGYLRHPAETARRFVPHPRSRRAGGGERLFATGDRARWRPDGQLEFLGRHDGQVKIRGFRLELGEIEAELERLPAVRLAAVVARRERAGQTSLLAYVVGEQGEDLDTASLRERLASSLPAWMIPGRIVRLDGLPLTAHGKIDRGALLALEPETDRGGEPYVAPATPQERLLCAIWERVLRLPRIGRQDDFFALGGDSILAIQVVAQARQAGLLLSPRDLFTHPTIAELAASSQRAGEGSEAPPLVGSVPLSPIQLWFFAQPLADRHHFNQARLLRAPRGLAPDVLAAAVTALVARHDMLRARFLERDGSWQQEVLAPEQVRPRIAVIDLSLFEGGAWRDALQQGLDSAGRSFDLAQAPLFHVVRFRLPAGEDDRLLLVAHHLVMDEVSWQILLPDLDRASLQAAQGLDIRLPPRTTSYGQWVELQIDLAQRPPSAWRAHRELAAADRPLPADPLRRAAGEHRQQRLTFALERGAASTGLAEAARRLGARPLELLLASLVEAFAGWTGERRLRVALEGHGREQLSPEIDLSRTVGWFTARYPLELDLGSSRPVRDAVASVARALERLPQGGIGHGVLRWLSPDPEERRRRAMADAVEVGLNFLGERDAVGGWLEVFSLAEEEPGEWSSPRSSPACRFDLQAWSRRGALEASWTFDPQRDSAEGVEELANAWRASLCAVLALADSLPPLARVASQTGTSAPGRPRSDNDPAIPPQGSFPLSPLQQGIFFHSLVAAAAGEYVDLVLLEPPGDFDLDRFRQVGRRWSDAHPALRSAFGWAADGEPRQWVLGTLELPMEVLDWSGLAPGEADRREAELVAALRVSRLEPTSPPLWRLLAVRRSRERWQLFWVQHHLIADGWSKRLLLEDLVALYGGTAPELLPVRRPYEEFIHSLAQAMPAAAEAFWRRTLSGAAPASLPWGWRPPARGESPGAYGEDEVAFPAPRLRALEAWARARGLTLATVLTGVWALVLARHAGRHDVIFGTVVSGRSAPLEGVAQSVGLFINTLPTRVAVRGAAPLAEWLADLQRSLAEARQFEHTPLTEVQRWCGWRPAGPLFHSVLVVEGAHEHAACAWPTHDLSSQATGYPLHLLVRVGERAVLRLTHSVDTTEPAAAARLLDHVLAALESLDDPRVATVAQVRSLAPAELEEILAQGRGPRSEPDGWRAALWPAFVAQAESTPDAVAAIEEGGCTSYAALHETAERLAGHLAAGGVGAESLVAVGLERSSLLLVAILGVFRAGAAYLPLEPQDPPARLGRLLARSRTARVLACRESRPSVETALAALPPGERPLVELIEPLLSQAPPWKDPTLGGAGEADALAYVLYTSGSTGEPKGAMVLQKGMANHLWAKVSALGLSSRDRVAQTASQCFDISVWQMLAPLLRGGAVVFVGDETAHDPAALWASVAQHQVTVLETVPSLLRLLLDEGTADSGSLRWHLATGEALPVEVATTWSERHPRAPLLNAYGPTECSDDITHHLLEAGPPLERERVPIGRALANLHLVVVDGDGYPAPPGVPGELWAGGLGVGRGYWQDAARTAEVFVPDPWSEEPGARCYRTGDRVRLCENGAFDYLGRLDQQVKVRGLRLELGEVEAAMRSHPKVAAAAARVWPEPDGDLLLAGYFTVRRGERLAAADLRRHLLEQLPFAAVPSRLVALEALPLNANGKVDRNALPRREEAAPERPPALAPRSELERTIARVWQEVLGLAEVGVTESFFDLGGHSLQLIQLRNRLQAALGRQLTVVELLQRPTVAGLAEHLRRARRERDAQHLSRDRADRARQALETRRRLRAEVRS